MKPLVCALLLIGAFVLPAREGFSQNSSDCSSLSDKEQRFANQLNRKNRSAFCNTFTSDQRGLAMELTGQKDEYGEIMDENTAVEKVIREIEEMKGENQ
jgi:hypothetical protein